TTENGLRNHTNAKHPYCDDCYEPFSTTSEYNDHCNIYHFEEQEASEEEEWPSCSICGREFSSERGVQQHVATVHAFEEHLTCVDCQRTFGRPDDLGKRHASGVHSARNVVCPFCHVRFRLPSAVAQHLENGKCPCKPNMTRQDVKDFFRDQERRHNLEGAVLVPRITDGRSAGSAVPQRATAASWNGFAYACCVCNREFQGLSQLNAHLITHESRDWRCFRCRSTYNLLSALVQHWEQSACGSHANPATKLVGRQRMLGYPAHG
ncbi:hypothetical protein DFJ77DRAFT_433735, partial [Powellomyces hirtus]